MSSDECNGIATTQLAPCAPGKIITNELGDPKKVAFVLLVKDYDDSNPQGLDFLIASATRPSGGRIRLKRERITIQPIYVTPEKYTVLYCECIDLSFIGDSEFAGANITVTVTNTPPDGGTPSDPTMVVIDLGDQDEVVETTLA